MPPGASPVPPKRGWHLSGMFDAMERGDLTALYVIGENPIQSEADRHRTIKLIERPRVPRRPGHVPDEDCGDRRRRAAGRGRLGRERGHGHELRAPRPAGAQGARAAGRGARRPVDRLRARPPDGPRLGRGVRRADLGRAAHALAGPRRDELQAARGARRDPVAVLRREPPGRAVPPLAALGGPGARATGCRFVGMDHDPPVDKLVGGLPDPADDRPAPRLVQHRRPDRRLHVAAAARRIARHLARGRGIATDSSPASGSGSSRAAARSRSRSGSTSH